MDILSIIIFLGFLLFRAYSESQKKQRDSRRYPQQQPREIPNRHPKNENERPWWEEKSNPQSITLKKNGKIAKDMKVKGLEQVPGQRNKHEKRKMQDKEKLAKELEKNLQLVESQTSEKLNLEKVREGIIWSEILQPPKAKRNQGFRHKI